MNPAKRREIFRRFQAANPNPTTELRYRTPYELLVAVVLSAQATDKSVNQASAVLFERFDTPEKMVKLGAAPARTAEERRRILKEILSPKPGATRRSSR